MSRKRRQMSLFVLLVVVLAVGPADLRVHSADSFIAKRSSSLIAITPEGTHLFAVNPDSDSVSVLDIRNDGVRLMAEVPVGANPGTVAVGPDGHSVYVTSQDDDALFAFELGAVSQQGELDTRSVDLLRAPYGAIADPDGTRVYVAESGAGSIAVIDARSFEIQTRVNVDGTPKGLAISESGERLYVTDFLTGALFEIDTREFTLAKIIQPPYDSNLALSVVLDPSEEIAALPQTRPNTDNTDLAFDTTVFPTVSLVDLTNGSFLTEFRIDLHIIDQPVSLPIDAVWGHDDRLYVLNASSNDISVINLATFEREGHLSTGEHPRGIAISPDGKRLFVNNTLDGTVGVIDVETLERRADVPITSIPIDDDVLLGKVLFNSADRPELAKDQWISCAICHFDGGMDGRTWILGDGPRNTPSLSGVRETLPIHWSGDLDELADVERTIRTLQAGTGLVDAERVCEPSCDESEPLSGRSPELDALVAYLRSLNPPESLSENDDAEQMAAVERGRAIFSSAATGCSSCHIPPLYTDAMTRDVGTATSPLERNGTAFDTPSLRGVGETPPYLHDGSADTLRDVLIEKNPNDNHGSTSHLSDDEIDGLIRFLLSL